MPSPLNNQTGEGLLFITQEADDRMLLEIDSPWETSIMAGPTIISLLEQLMLLFGKDDYSLIEDVVKNSIQVIHHPSSFRAILAQLRNDMWAAFLNAHINMDKIELLLQQVIKNVKNSLKIFFNATKNSSRQDLSLMLNNLNNTGEHLVSVSNEIENSMNTVIQLLGIIMEHIAATYGHYKVKYDELLSRFNVSDNEKEQLKKLDVNFNKHQEKSNESKKNKNNSDSVFTGPNVNERQKVLKNIELLRDAEERAAEMFDQMQKLQEETHIKIQMAIKGFDIRKFREMGKLMRTGINIFDHLSHLRQECHSFINFFQTVSVRVAVTQSGSVMRFIHMLESTLTIEDNYSISDQSLFIEILHDDTVYIHKVLCFLYTLSNTYLYVSNEFIMGKTLSLAKMLSISDEFERNSILDELKKQNVDPKEDIDRIVTKKRQFLNRFVQQKIDDIKTYYLQTGYPCEMDVKLIQTDKDT